MSSRGSLQGSRSERRKKAKNKEKFIGIALLVVIIAGMLCTNRVLANDDTSDKDLGNESEVIDVKWSRTKEPTNEEIKEGIGFINTMNDEGFNNNVQKVDQYNPSRTENMLIFSAENLGGGSHTITFTISGERNSLSTGNDGHISYAKIFTNADDENYMQIDAVIDYTQEDYTNKFLFSQGWNQEVTSAWTSETGRSFTINFTGEKIELYGIKTFNHGIMNVSIDADSYYSNTVIDGKVYSILDNYPGKSEGILPEGRVITTPKGIYNNQIGNRMLLDYDVLTEMLNPTEIDKVWDGNLGNENRYYNGYIDDKYINDNNYLVQNFATWSHFGSDDSWRLFKGDFNLDLSSSDMKNKRVYIGVLGENGPELIMPLNDFMIVLIDGKPTDINFTTQVVTDPNRNNIKLRMSDGTIYTPTFKQAYHNSPPSEKIKCSNSAHNDISRHTDTWHAHLTDDAESSPDGGYRLGDITPFLNDGNEHKIEVLCADNTGGGGGTKLDVFLVDAPSMKIEKGGFVLDDTKDGDDKKVEIGDDSHVYPGEAVYYTLSMTNNGIDRLNTLEFNDELINIKINSAGIYNLRTGENLNTDGLKITKISKSEDGTETNRVTKTADKALELLNELYPNETVIVEDLNNIKYEVTQEDLKRPNKQIVNTVIGTAKYLNNQLTAEAEASFKVTVEELIKPMVAITKEVFKVKRGGTIIYSAEDSAEESSVVPGLYPGDEVSFYFTITNKTNDPARPYNKDLPVTNLSLTDSLSSPYTNPEWEFTCDDILEFNYNNFDLKPKQTIKVIASTWVVPEPFDEEDEKINVWDYNVINTVNLFKGYNYGKFEKLDEATANVKILPPKLYLKKVITNVDKDKDSSNRIFTINIKGNDGSKFTIEAKVEEVYTIDNLRYGVTYTVDEVVPANYQLSDIKFKEAQSGDTEVSIENSGISIKNSGIQLVTNNRDINVNQGIINAKDGLITVINNVVNDNYFYDDAVKTNTFKYPLDSSKN